MTTVDLARRWRGLALMVCALLALLPRVTHAAPSGSGASPEIVSGLNGRVRLLVPRGSGALRIVRVGRVTPPLDRVAVPGSAFQVVGTGRSGVANAYLTITVRAHNYADPAVYQQVRGRWLRLPTHQRFRAGRTLSLNAGAFYLERGAVFAVLARRTPGRPLHIRPIIKHHREPPPVGVSPPVHDGH